MIEKKGSKTKSGWFRTKGYNAILRVENTPSGRLARQVRDKINSDPDLACMKILVQEKNGIQLAGICNFIDPYTPDYCGREDCFVCLTAGKPTRGVCWKEGIH